MSNQVYLVMSISTEVYIGMGSQKTLTNLTWAEGMIGACPAFEDRELAKRYASEVGGSILEVERLGKK